jgi:hypothetical protein
MPTLQPPLWSALSRRRLVQIAGAAAGAAALPALATAPARVLAQGAPTGD